MLGSGFEWYDTNQAHIVINATFRRCGVERASSSSTSSSGGAAGSSSIAADGSGCGDGVRGCGRTSSVWSLLAFSDQHVPKAPHTVHALTTAHL